MSDTGPQVLAAVDLGSNSFHMVVGRYSHGDIVILDRIREMVRLGAGLDADDAKDLEELVRLRFEFADADTGSAMARVFYVIFRVLNPSFLSN